MRRLQRVRRETWIWIDRIALYLLVLGSLIALGFAFSSARAADTRRLADQEATLDRQAELIAELNVVVDNLEESQSEAAEARRQFRQVARLLLEQLGVEADPFAARNEREAEPSSQPTGGNSEPQPRGDDDQRRRRGREDDQRQQPERRDDRPPQDEPSPRPQPSPSPPPPDGICLPIVGCLD